MRYGTWTLVGLAAVFFLWLPSGSAPAAELGGVEMAETQTVGDQSLVLNGLGLRKKAIFKVYVGGLYLPAKNSDPASILAADQPRRLIMEFVRKVGGDQISGGWDDCLANNASGASADVKQGFMKLNGWMSDVDKGDRLTFTYEPGTGTSIDVKGKSAGSVAGKPFADALFSCWIGDAPPSEDFKEGLLGR